MMVVAVCVTAWLMAQRTGGEFLYGSDDFYINLGLARRLVDGTVRGEFPSGTTCAGWVLGMAALIKVAGASGAHCLAGVINLVAVLVMLWVVARQLGKHFSASRVIGFLFLFVWMTGLVPLILIGMEHVLHIVFVTLFGVGLLRCMEGDCRAERWLPVWILLGALCRMEMVFVAAGGAIALLLARRTAVVIPVLVTCVIPMLAQGIWQLWQGHSFFANPILIKTIMGSDDGFPGAIVGSVSSLPSDMESLLLANALVAAVLLPRRKPAGGTVGYAHVFLLMLVVCAGLHQMLVKDSWLGRYHAYLMALGVLVLAISTSALCEVVLPKRLRVGVWLLGGMLVLLLLQGGMSRAAVWYRMPQVSWEIHAQMRQAARFAAEVEHGEAVVLNDVGCTLYFTDAPVLDIYGLTSWEVANLGGGAHMTSADIAALSQRRQAKMAVLYPEWFQSRLPLSWVAVGEWETPSRCYAAETVVRVFATAEEHEEEVRARWNRLAVSLPQGVIVRAR